MRAFTISMFISAVACNTSLASDAENQAKSFATIYASLCMKNLSNLEGLRAKLKDMPKLPPEKSIQFLSGNPGDAWPVPDKNGTFVLALPSNKNICMVYARRADATKAEEMFVGLVGNSPAPLISRLAKDERAQTIANGPTHTISYEWSVPNAARTMLFTLTTASSNNAQLQALGSATIVDN
ncbi:hypothetical protein NVV93_11940 [Pseudomonas sp. LS44]|uniref:NMCC_0638 family (lipo)protein n=1 Tax=Pseudomonas sp. LS44 TaxID=1357074 RepID=UPI00215A4282|nr:hypothetical protein [Pseudomonas sp. LS44]UVE16324.1 hypothetical protein NVV93_11940 [Pseudomonas sp. LS44]